jgi:predicted TIM-barrel fold metal-dependent hydrolase
MIIDINAFLGHYPFRQLRFNSAAKMVELMDGNGIDRAVVSSLHAVFYRDAHRGNAELYEETKAYGARFIPVATVNPKYVGWQHDLAEAVQRWKMKAVTLVPAHHGYSLTDQHGQAALEAIANYGLPVVLTQRFEDRRQRHHWDIAEDLEIKTLIEVAKAHPRLKFLLSNWIGLDGPKLVDAGMKGRCLIDFARLHVLLNKDVPKLIAALGVEAIAFGSHMPFDYVGPSLVKLANLENLPQADYEKIAWRNAATFLNIGD